WHRLSDQSDLSDSSDLSDKDLFHKVTRWKSTLSGALAGVLYPISLIKMAICRGLGINGLGR
ncbi:hypothetical protein, partial [uncultured Porphyromonas sp.]|uniref:hypothetical protein n=1 Tax=uncultured Porphyromonas sp. TaxID=159274 RepID=UPI00258C2251